MTAKAKSYAEAFGDRFDIPREVNTRRLRGIENLVSLLSQRLECEAEYSKSMQKIGSTNHNLYDGFALSIT